MTCDKCQDVGLVVVNAQGYQDPLFSNEHVRAALPHYGDHPLVLNCECRYANPLLHDDVVEVVCNWVENKIYPKDLADEL